MKFSVYGFTYVHGQTYTRVLQCSLTSVGFTQARPNRLHSCCLWRRRCSLAVALSSRFRRNLSVALRRSIGVELHSEESSVSLSRLFCQLFEFWRALARVQIWNVHVNGYPFVQFKFSVYGLTYVDRHTHVLQCSLTSVGLAQAHPSYVHHTLVD